MTTQPDLAIPSICMDGLTVLDVGCGNGHALMYPQYANARRVGIDVDTDAIAAGCAKFPELTLMHGSAENLPLPPETYDVVVSRVALPYTDIREALAEANRVMVPGGHLFLTMHDWRHQWEFLSGAIKKLAFKRLLDHVYIVAASTVFIAIGKVIKRPSGTRETFQTEGSMRRELRMAGFADVAFSRTARHWRVTAKKG